MLEWVLNLCVASSPERKLPQRSSYYALNGNIYLKCPTLYILHQIQHIGGGWA